MARDSSANVHPTVTPANATSDDGVRSDGGEIDPDLTNVTRGDILTSGRLARNYDPEHFAERITALLDAGVPDPTVRSLVRRSIRTLDSGRFVKMLDEAHWVMAHSDNVGRKWFAKNFPTLLEWVVIYGWSENLNTFRGWHSLGIGGK